MTVDNGQLPYVNVRCLPLEVPSGTVKAYQEGGNTMLQENIKALRKERGLTQEELAIRVNVVRQTVSKWEKGVSQR